MGMSAALRLTSSLCSKTKSHASLQRFTMAPAIMQARARNAIQGRTTMSTVSVTDEILAREAMRCKAVMAADIETLTGLVEPDLVHVHVTARVNTQQEYLDGIRSRS